MKPIPDNIIKWMTPSQRKEHGVSTSQERRAKRVMRAEKVLQNLVSQWLHLSGYWRRSPADIRIQRPSKGWQIHIVQCRKNPLLLDFLLLHNNGAYFEFELKIPGGRYTSKEQEILCEHHNKPVLTDLESVIKYVTDWENSSK